MSVKINYNVPTSAGGEFAAVYARYSSHSQGEQSIEGQLSEAHKYAVAHGYTIVHEYIDRAKSGRSDNREQFQKMLKDTAKKQFSVIILWKVDRFGRNREEIALNKIKCRKNGVRVEYVAETIPNSPEGVILESVLEGFAEYYSLQLSQNIRRGLAESAEKCQCTGGNRPLGYLTGPDKKFIIDPDTAPTVKLIYEMYAAGHSVTEIVAHLNKLGLRTLRGGKFTHNSLHTILKNEKYIGYYTYKGNKVEGGVPRIIDDELFYKVQDMLKINKRAPAHRWSRADYILTDKLFCGKCNSAMIGESGTGKQGVKYNYYICSGKKRHKSCDKKAVKQEIIEQLVINTTVDLLKDDELMEFIAENTWQFYKAQDDSRDEVNAMKAQLAEVNTSIENLVKAIQAGIINDVVQRQMKELEEQRQQLVSSLAEWEIAEGFHITREYVTYYFDRFRKMDFTNRDCQKELIKVFVNSVFVFDDHLLINYNFSSDSVTVSLEDVSRAEAGEGFVYHALCSTKSITGRTPETTLVVLSYGFVLVSSPL